MRDRLVARHADAALERPGAAGGQRRGGCGGVTWRSVRARDRSRPSTGRRRIPRDAIDSGHCKRPRETPLFPSFRTVQGFRTVAKPELGTKRLCGSCGAKFYDLSKDPIICPKCGTVFEVVVPVSRAADAAAAAAAAARSGGRSRCGTRAGQGEPRRQAGDAGRRVRFARGRRRRGRRARRRRGADGEATTISRSRRPKRTIRPSSKRQEEGDDDVTDIIGEGREDEEET